MTRLADADARIKAATDFDSNLVVVAGAGTGKTGLLVERFLNLVLSDRAEIEHVVAITFTEKAAGEMKARVVESLDAVLAATDIDAPSAPAASEAARSLRWLMETKRIPAATLRERALRCLDTLERVFIGTIHAFCTDIIRRHPAETGLPPSFTVDEGFGQDVLFEEEWTDFLARELGPNPPRPDLWGRVLARFLEQEIEDVAASLARSSTACDHLAGRGYEPLDVQTVFGRAAEQLLDEIRVCREEVGGGTRMPELLECEEQLLEHFLDGGPDRLRSVETESLPVPDFWERRRSNLFKVRVQSGREDRKEAIEAVAGEALQFLQRMKKIERQPVADLMEALRPFAQSFRKRVRRDGTLSFSDLLLVARNLLRDDAEVRAAESDRCQAILVDEFQDTDPLQYEIVFLLASSGTSEHVEDPYTVPLRPGRLFIVGDPKQSIYRFRGADIGAYTRAADHLADETAPARLVTNFRSRAGILRPVNRLFAGWMGPASPAEKDIEPEYEEIQPFRPNGSSSCAELWSVQSEAGVGAEQSRRKEARRIAAEIRSWLDGGSYSPREIALLFRALPDVPIYARALREAGIRFVVDGGKAFVDRPEVVDAFSLLRAIANPADPVATVAVLRSSLGGVPDAMLAEYADAGGRFRWNAPGTTEGTPEFPLIEAAFAQLRDLDRERARLPLDRWIQKTLTESNFSLLLTSYFEGAQRLANVRKLAERAASLARERRYTLEQTIEALEQEFGGARTEGESPLADEGLDAVRILTIHKAKGLEYPVVLVPDVARGRPGPDFGTQVALMRTGGHPFLAAWLGKRLKMNNTAAAIVEETHRQHEDAENKRLLYVATTRAKERLVLVNNTPNQRTDWAKRLKAAWGYLCNPKDHEHPYPDDNVLLAEGDVLHRLFRDEPQLTAPEFRPADPEHHYRGFLRAVEAASQERPPRFRNPSRDHRAERVDSVSEDGAAVLRDPDVARAAGVVVHRLLEDWNFRDREILTAKAAAVAEVTAWETRTDPAQLLGEIEAILEGFLASELPAYLAGVEILGREVSILFRDAAGTTVHGYADLVYRRDGRVHVADYKTDAATDRDRAETYRSQLTDYADAIARSLNLAEPPTAEVLFVRNGTRVELPGVGAS